MAWRFRSGVKSAAVGRDLVLLDLDADTYACIPNAGVSDAAFATDLDQLDDDVLSVLRDAGLIERRRTASAQMALPSVAIQDLGALHLTKAVDVPVLINTGRAALTLRRAGADPSLSELVACATSRRPVRSDADAAIRQAVALDRLLPWLPGRRECLQRSALLVRLLADQGLGADWVFGVRTWPFRAHCWVQIDGVCLNDDAERLRPYTPIYST